jgi:choline monooxygenase
MGAPTAYRAFEPLTGDDFHSAGPLKRGLPAHAYTSDAFFEAESRHLFPAAWTFVGFAHELPSPGDVAPVTVGGRPVLLVRNRDGAIAAFHNVCRHRCAILVDAPANVGQFLRCPYHCWVYDLDGTLRKAPYFGGPGKTYPDGFAPEDHGLLPVRAAVWHDWIFVNLDGMAPPFDDYAVALRDRLAGIPFDTLRPVGMIDMGEVATNWKFLMENFIEPYHVQFVHPATTRQPLLNHSTFVDGRCLGSAVDLDPAPAGAEGGAAKLDVSSRYLTLFPNFVLGWYEPDQLGVHLNVPLGPGRTAQRRVLYHTGAESLSEAAVEEAKGLWRKVHREDHEICERLQRGRASPVADEGGVLSPHWEDSVRAFQELVADAVKQRTEKGWMTE